MVDLRINETLQDPVGAVRNRTASAQLETAPTIHEGRKRLSVFRIYYSFHSSALRHFTSLATYVSHKEVIN